MADELEFGPVLDSSITSEEAIGARMDADVNQGIAEGDDGWIDTRPVSMWWFARAAITQEAARIWDALSVEVPSAAFPTRAFGEWLDEWMAAFGKERNRAVKAIGEVLFRGDEGALVPAQTRLSAVQTDPNIPPPEFLTTDSGGAISITLDTPAGLEGAKAAGGALTVGNTYHYVVTAINDYGETLASNEVAVKVETTDLTVNLVWTPVEEATGYRVYRSEAAGTASKRRIATVVNASYSDIGIALSETKLPEANNTGGQYRATVEAVDAGEAGDVGVGAITTIQDGLEGVESVTNPEPTLNGADEEDDDALRTRLFLEFHGSGGGNQTDYQRWALDLSEVGMVTVIPVADGPGTVTLVISGASGDPLSEDTVDDLQFDLDPLPGQGLGLAPIDHTVSVVTPEAVAVVPQAELEFEEGFSLDGIAGTTELRPILNTALSKYINDAESGEDVIYDHAKATLFSVQGVYKVPVFKLNGATADIAISSSPAQTAVMGTPILTE